MHQRVQGTFSAVAGNVHGVAFLPERLLQEAGHLPIVLDDEDPHGTSYPTAVTAASSVQNLQHGAPPLKEP